MTDLKEYLSYNPNTGLFIWLKGKNKGKPAGSYSGLYVRINLCGKLQYAHRLAVAYMTGEMPETSIDHKNRDTKDNRYCNLRIAGYPNNGANSKRPSNNTSGFKGVYFCKYTGKYRARIYRNNRKYELGRFETAQEAANARADAATHLHKEFARVG